MLLNLWQVGILFVGHFNIIIVLILDFCYLFLFFFDMAIFYSCWLIESLQDFGELFLLCISQFLILDELLKFFNEDFLDFLRVFIFSEKEEEKVDVKSALSFICKSLEHSNDGIVCKF